MLPTSDHVVWSLLKVVVYMVSLTLILYLTASNFDFTEVRTLAMMFLVAGSTEGIVPLLRSLNKQD